jgi:hypothetical protein
MKKFILGFVCGALIFGGTAVLADGVSLIGKTVDGEVPVFYNDEPLVAKAITVEGTSYLPVRTVGNTLGAQIEYRDGAVHVEQKNDTEIIKQQVMNEIKIEMRKEEIRKNLDGLKKGIEAYTELANQAKQNLEIETEPIIRADYERTIRDAEQIIQKNQQKIAELEAELAALEQQQDESEDEE